MISFNLLTVAGWMSLLEMGPVGVIVGGPRASRPAPLNAVPDLTGVGSEEFLERTKVELGIRAKGRKVLEGGEAYQLREPQISYPDGFGTKNVDIGAENGYFWNINPDIST